MRIRINLLVWERAGFAAILLLAAGLRLWGLGGTGYGNAYYAAGVRSMLLGWRNFVFAAYDPAGFVSLDKPPVAFWVQAAFAKLLGFSGFSILLPQALAGVATVAVLYRLVRRAFGPGAGLLAAFSLAIMPLSVAVDRVNNTDSLLVLVLVLAASPMIHAAKTGRLSMLLLGMALVGVAFNVKMLAAYVVLPAFVLLYLLTAPVAWRTRLGHLAAGAGVLLAVSWSWALAVDLTPPTSRPYVGDSRNNTELDLILGYNGIARLVAGTRWGASRGARPEGTEGAATPATASAPAGSGPAFPPPGGRGFGGGEPGPLRLANRELAAQITWLFPLAAMGLMAGAMPIPRRQPLDLRRQAVLLWGVWLVSGGIVFSFARGMFRPFYVVTLAPALAALVGVGVVAMWADYRGAGWRRALLPASFLATAAWQGYVLHEYPDWGPMLLPCVVGGSLIAATILVIALARPGGTGPRTAAGALAMGLLWLFISPMAWAVTPVVRGGGGVPTAGPDALARGQRRGWVARRDLDVQRLVSFLRAQRRGERFLLATVNAMQASPIIIQTVEPVMAIGGWSGGDPILTVDQFTQLVADGQVRYVLVPERDGEGMWGGRLAGTRNADLVGWVREHGRPVDPALWRSETTPSDGPGVASPVAGRGVTSGAFGGGRRAWPGVFGRVGQLYDCRPAEPDRLQAAEGAVTME